MSAAKDDLSSLWKRFQKTIQPKTNSTQTSSSSSSSSSLWSVVADAAAAALHVRCQPARRGHVKKPRAPTAALASSSSSAAAVSDASARRRRRRRLLENEDGGGNNNNDDDDADDDGDGGDYDFGYVLPPDDNTDVRRGRGATDLRLVGGAVATFIVFVCLLLS
jgi:hypothetical protein